jgi:hypothetical protein
MIGPVSSATQAQPQVASQPAQTRPPVHASTRQALVTDTVQISNAAKILQEATETPAQTAKEAASGDRQAKALLAREAAVDSSVK